jgi:uncharacterized protein YcbX
MTTLGTLARIARYPVKSMRGEELESTAVAFQGLPLDRSFAFVQEGVHTPFPWLTGRECPQLLQCQPIVGEGRWPAMRVHSPAGEFELGSAEFAAQLHSWSGRRAVLHSDYRGCQDVAYVSVISTATIRALAETAGVPVDHRRFRMNFVVDLGDTPFAEKAWVGRQVRLGDVVIAVHEQDRRCQMITLDPETGASTPAVLKAAGELNEVYAGVYGSVLVPGEVSVGDEIAIA